MATGMFGKRVVKLLVIFSVTIGLYFLTVSLLRFGRFLAGFSSPLTVRLPSYINNIYLRIILNWTLASCYLYSPQIVGCVVRQIGNLSGLPNCYLKFTKIVLLVSILNGKITLWQAVPEICLWHLNYAEHTHFYLHCFIWIIWLMIVFAIDIMEIAGVKTILYYNLTNGNCCSLKSQQFDQFLSNMGLPGSTCLIIILWSQKVMSLDRFILAVIWTLGILSNNQMNDIDIKYVARQMEKKRLWMYFSERITFLPLK